MNVRILGLGEVGREDRAVAGGKGANLGEMVRQGFPVPPGFVVPAAACQAFFQHIGLGRELEGHNDLAPDDHERRCHVIRSLIEKAPLPAELSEAIMTAHAELIQNCDTEIRCAVRSSGTAEDLGEASFAGQHETYYYVGADRLLDMVKHCWSSLFSLEAVSYRATQRLDHGDVFMAVVVQEMIQSEVSGVTFTANPVTGDREEIVTESSWGMGAAIVDGRVTPDHYVFEREGLRLKEKRIAEKKFMVPPRLSQTTASRLQEVPHSLRLKETLSPDQARTVAEWAQKAENHFGCPQDVEWAMAGGRFYLLQSRPITIMGRQNITEGVEGQYVIFKPLIENFTDPVTPLTGDVVSLFFSPPLGCLVRGWPYLSLKYCKAVLPYQATDEELASLLYGMDVLKTNLKLFWLKLPLFLGLLLGGYLFFGVLLARTRRMPVGFMDRFRDLVRRTDADDKAGPFEMVKRFFSWSRYFDPIGNQAFMVNLGAVRYMFRMSLLRQLIRRWTLDLREDAEALLCSGAEGVLSAEMGRGIWDLAQEVKKSPKTRRILEAYQPENVLAVLKDEPEAQEFLAHLGLFLEINGHRAFKEWELASIRWAENPAPVLGMVRNYLLIDSDPVEHERSMARSRRDLDAEIRRRLEKYPLEKAFRPRYRLICYIAERAKYFSRQRENSRFYYIMGFSALRKKILRVEAELLAAGKLKCRGDIFFLHLPEIDRLQSGRLEWSDVEVRIRERRLDHIRLSKMFPPKTIGVTFAEKQEDVEDQERDGKVLHGQPASPGEYEGVAHLILDPSISLELKPGEVLVAPYTDPAWTPLFLTAGAAVVEVGSYLSHAGTVAREFGMPCVVDLQNCTKLIHSGVIVRVQGDRGLVRIISRQGGQKA